MRKILAMISLSLAFIFGGNLFFVHAATRTVDTTSDNGALTACTAAANDCSLRGAVSGAAAGDTINFDASLIGSTITLGSLISFSKALNIAGPGADKLTVSGGNATSIFEAVSVNGAVNFSGVTFADGNGANGNNGGQGGAIEINSVLTATFDAVVFRDNTAAVLGGALLCFANTCRISNSTFYNNSAPAASVLYQGFGNNEITNTTITGNNETSSTYGTLYLRGNTIIRNSTIADNPGRSNIYVSTESVTFTLGNTIIAGSAASDIFRNGGTINTDGGNLIGKNINAGTTFAAAGMPNVNADYVGTNAAQINPMLAALTNNGGTTPTRALQGGSPALNHGNNCVLTNLCVPAMFAALTNDQRGAGFLRQFGVANVDIGAFESQLAPTAANILISGRILTADGRGLSNAIVTLTDQNGITRTVRSSSFGYFRFEEVEAGQICVVSVISKRFQFAPQVISVSEDMTELNFYGAEK